MKEGIEEQDFKLSLEKFYIVTFQIHQRTNSKAPPVHIQVHIENDHMYTIKSGKRYILSSEFTYSNSNSRKFIQT